MMTNIIITTTKETMTETIIILSDSVSDLEVNYSYNRERSLHTTARNVLLFSAVVNCP